VSAQPAASAVLLDIEGTTTPIDFVHDVLFPYARQRVEAFVSRHFADEGVMADVRALREEHDRDVAEGRRPPPWPREPLAGVVESVAAYVRWLIDLDRKTTPLKSLQGRIWQEGYRSGELRGQVYEDVSRAFHRWHGQGRRIAVFSSGSVLAQKLLFAHSTEGPLDTYVDAYFDTTTGSKTDAESYRRIAAALDRPAGEVLFLSDIAAELDAAREAGMDTRLSVRSEWVPPESRHPVVRTFDDV
jgi:enolase-phosphatase E1